MVVAAAEAGVARREESRLVVRVCSGVLLPDEVVSPAATPEGRGPTRDATEVAPRVLEVVCMRAGQANGLYYPPEVLRRSVEEGLWEGRTVLANHAGPLDQGRAGGRTIEDVAGVLNEARYSEGGAILGRLTLFGPKSEIVARLAAEMLAAQEAGEPAPNVGLSADLYVERRPGRAEVARILAVNSLDVVYNPAAGGAFLRILNGEGAGIMEEAVAVQGQEVATVGEEGMQEGLRTQLSNELFAQQCNYLLEAALLASDLPQPFKEDVRQQFDGRIFRPEELQRSMKRKREVWANLLEGQVVQGVGASIRTRDGLERIRLAAMRLFGLPVPEEASAIQRLSGIRELYLKLTGDYDFRGVVQPEHAELANVTTTTMASVTADVLNKVMLQAYNRRERWWVPIVANRDLERFQEMKMLRVYGFSSLSTVSEGAAYAEKTWSDLQETATIVKKGNYVGITLEMIMADDVEAVRAIPQLLGSAAYNTVSDTVAGVFTTSGGVGPLMADGTALFDATRGNLGSTALASDSFDAGQVAIMSQTEPGSARKLGMPARYLLVPVQLRSTAMVIRNSQLKPGGSNNDVNPWYDQFEVVVVPPWTDTNNWALATEPAAAEHVVLGWLQGKREPEIFTATDELAGSMFSNDELRIKVRFFICCGVADYRGLYKANVA